MSTTDTTDANAFLMGGSGARAAFTGETPLNTIVGGTIVDTAQRQQTDFQTKNPKFWDNGDPMMQLVVIVATDLSEDGEDDGQRAFYLKGGSKRENTTQGAVAKAVREAGASGLEIGGKLEMACVGTEPSTRGNPRKLWSARYAKPTVPVGDNDPFGSAAPAAAANDPFADDGPGF